MDPFIVQAQFKTSHSSNGCTSGGKNPPLPPEHKTALLRVQKMKYLCNQTHGRSTSRFGVARRKTSSPGSDCHKHGIRRFVAAGRAKKLERGHAPVDAGPLHQLDDREESQVVSKALLCSVSFVSGENRGGGTGWGKAGWSTDQAQEGGQGPRQKLLLDFYPPSHA